MGHCKSPSSPDLTYFDNRLKTLMGEREFLDFLSVDPNVLAHAGFYYENKKVKCHECGYILGNLVDLVEPCFEHLYYTMKTKHSCYYVRKTTGTVLPHNSVMHKFSSNPCDMREFGPHRFGRVVCFSNPPSYRYDLFMNRYTSFSGVVDLPISPLILAHLGFCFKDSVRKIQCYDCDFDLSYHTSLRMIFKHHMSQSCDYMKTTFGSDVTIFKSFKCLT